MRSGYIFLKQKGAYLWTVVIITIVLLAIFAPFLTSYSPSTIVLNEKLLSPSWQHLFGTDKLGRDIFSRTIYGARISLAIGIISRLLAIIIGTTFGLIAGYYGGLIDGIISRIVDSTLAFPSLLLAIGIAFFIGPGFTTLIISLTIVSWAPVVRLVRASVLSVKNELFVEAAIATGCSDLRIIFKHIFPNIFSIVIITFTSGIASAIMGESSLTFLGLGPDPSIPTWGQMISSGLRDIFSPPPSHPWLYMFPGFFLFITILSFNMMGDLLRDALDPKLRR
jgi:ABC-type dipeptide/oligopeptide/nickel transport system permease subunit